MTEQHANSRLYARLLRLRSSAKPVSNREEACCARYSERLIGRGAERRGMSERAEISAPSRRLARRRGDGTSCACPCPQYRIKANRLKSGSENLFRANGEHGG